MPFCPECKAEYREGFTKCSDCHIPLTDTLPDEILKEIQEKNEYRPAITKTLSIWCMIAAIVLMLLPYGVWKPIDIFYNFSSYTTSYFHVNYGNWFPLVTALLSILILGMLIFDHVKRKDYMRKYVLICIFIRIIASPLLWLIYGFPYTMTLTGLIVFLLHVATLVLQIKSKKASA